jgi:hypothetical protein
MLMRARSRKYPLASSAVGLWGQKALCVRESTRGLAAMGTLLFQALCVHTIRFGRPCPCQEGSPYFTMYPFNLQKQICMNLVSTKIYLKIRAGGLPGEVSEPLRID